MLLNQYLHGSLPFLLFTNITFSQNITLNEVLAANTCINQDGDGNFEDWVEIYNYGTTAVNLKGYIPSKTVSKTYFIAPANTFSLPVISLSLSENKLSDYSTGIYVAGMMFDIWCDSHPSLKATPYNFDANFRLEGDGWKRTKSSNDSSDCLSIQKEVFKAPPFLCLETASGKRRHLSFLTALYRI